MCGSCQEICLQGWRFEGGFRSRCFGPQKNPQYAYTRESGLDSSSGVMEGITPWKVIVPHIEEFFLHLQ